ncbi:hypothetical protein ABTZ03_33910 [Kitasatospora sp. NPDC096077]|uniref:hypothetical protein n=1 Tax=Kitasatospora sp. NPDC096077 TaxID=3155544 RepID=UPI00331B61CC
MPREPLPATSQEPADDSQAVAVPALRPAESPTMRRLREATREPERNTVDRQAPLGLAHTVCVPVRSDPDD